MLGAQRERSLIAATELLAATSSVRDIGIREIAREARLSTSAFYRCYHDKESCLLAGHARFVEVVHRSFIAALGSAADWDEQAAAAVESVLSLFSADPVTARAYLVGLEGLGEAARRRRRETITAMATALKNTRDTHWPGAEQLPVSAYEGAIVAIRHQVASALETAVDGDDLRRRTSEVLPSLARMLA